LAAGRGAEAPLFHGGSSHDLYKLPPEAKKTLSDGSTLEAEKMLDHAVLTAVAEQMMSAAEVVVGDSRFRVGRTGTRRLRTVRFAMSGREYQAIEQNPEKASHWAKLAREGHRVVQIRDLATQKYVAAVVDGKVREYL
jgi:hypothetical protein